MKVITSLLIALIFLAPLTANSQTRRRTRTAPPPRTTPDKQLAEARRQGAVRVANQVKDLSRFLYLLGGVAKGIEEMDEAARRKNLPPALLEQTQKNKNVVRTSIQRFREDLDRLEIDFRVTPALQPFYIKLAGSAAGAATAEQQAANNQLDQAGRSLLVVVNRLTDVLIEIK